MRYYYPFSLIGQPIDPTPLPPAPLQRQRYPTNQPPINQIPVNQPPIQNVPNVPILVTNTNDQPITKESLGDALKRITPTLIIVGIATGAAFAIGSGLIHKYLFKGR